MNAIQTSICALQVGCISLGSIALFPAIARASIPPEPTSEVPKYAQFEDFELSPGFDPDPQSGSGKSGGPTTTEMCGEIDNTPDHRLDLGSDFDFLRIWVDAPGDVTLLVEGPNGEQFCGDDENGVLPELSGAYSAGRYKIWVGDWGNSYDYNIYFSQTP
ncbi:MAG: hypothetical protein SWY16_11370 [Cyanobacteriota bacterium]|nr:hypothetical protein [Cyanobacteriota bacterium]